MSSPAPSTPSATQDTPTPSLASSGFESLLMAHSKNSPVRVYHLRAGSIALFHQNPKQKLQIRCQRAEHCGGQRLHFEGLAHAVLILSDVQCEEPDDEQKCFVAWITTHDNSTLATYIKDCKENPDAPKSIPIDHDDSYHGVKILRLQHSKLNKQSFVMINHIYAIPVSKLHNYVTRTGRPRSVRLQESSYVSVMQSFGLAAQAYQSPPEYRLQSFPSPPPEFLESDEENEQNRRPAIRYAFTINFTKDYINNNTYSGIRSAATVPTRLRAESAYFYHGSEFVSFPPLPPSPCRSPCHEQCTSPGLRVSRCLDENTPLLPSPVAYTSRRLPLEVKVRIFMPIVFALVALGGILFFWYVMEELGSLLRA